MQVRSGENEKRDLPVLQGLSSLWASIRKHWLTLVVMVVIWALLFLVATWVAADNWRDDLPRSTIGAVWVGLCVLTALALFGVPGSRS